jgi:hypothetical protein
VNTEHRTQPESASWYNTARIGIVITFRQVKDGIMNPSRHSVLHLAVIFGGAASGLMFGFLGGGLIVAVLEGQHRWIAAIGMTVGMAGIVFLSDWIVRRFVHVRCPSCGGRMKCKMSCSGGECYLWYICGACGMTECPTVDFWNRLLSSLLSGFNETKKKSDAQREKRRNEMRQL